jgi:hypothetical protein
MSNQRQELTVKGSHESTKPGKHEKRELYLIFLENIFAFFRASSPSCFRGGIFAIAESRALA